MVLGEKGEKARNFCKVFNYNIFYMNKKIYADNSFFMIDYLDNFETNKIIFFLFQLHK